MTWFRLRPTSVSLGLPGTSNLQAHAGKPANGQQSHHKFSTLDPSAALHELLAKEANPESRVRAMIDATPSESPAAVPRRRLSALLRGAAQTLGIARGEPLPKGELLRYMGTSPVPGGESDSPQRTDSRQGSAVDPSTLVAALVARLEEEQDVLGDRIAANEVAAAQALVAGHLDRVDGDLALRARRAGNLADKLHEMKQQSIDASAELATLRESIESTRGVLISTRKLLRRHLEALDLAKQAFERHLDASSQQVALSLGELFVREQTEDALAERKQSLASLVTSVGLLREVEDQERRSLGAMQADARQLEQRIERLGSDIAETQRLAGLNQRDLWEHNGTFDALQTLQGSLHSVAQARPDRSGTAPLGTTTALSAYSQADQLATQSLLDTCPGFEEAAQAPLLRESMQAWSETLEDRLAPFGADAMPMSLVLRIAFEAIGGAANHDARRAAELVQELQGLTLATLLPSVPATDSSLQPSAQAKALARSLAGESSGLQLLQLLMAPTLSPWHKLQAEAVRVFLIADEAKRKAPESDQASHDWINAAQRASRQIASSPSPADALDACTFDERAAYRAFRNGYESNAPGSPYDKANRLLKKPVEWLKDRAEAHRVSLLGPANPLNVLPQGLKVGAAASLPTPVRRAAQAMEEAAGHLNDLLAATRGALPQGWVPSRGDFAWQAFAHYVQWHPEESDPTDMRLDAQALSDINTRCDDLQRYAQREVATVGGGVAPVSALNSALDIAWQELQGGDRSVLDALNVLRVCMSRPAGEQHGGAEDAQHTHLERDPISALRARLVDVVTRANRLLHDGNPARVTSAQSLLDLSRDMIENLEWRDRLRLVGQKVWGVNAGPFSAAAGVVGLPTGVGVKLVAGRQTSVDEVFEIYMGRTGLFLQIGEQSTRQVQLGAGASLGYAWGLGDAENGARVGIGGALDWRFKRELGVENGVQLRVLRLEGGKEPELLAQFMDVYEHLLTLAGGQNGENTVPDDWMRELLARHPNLNIGLIDQATRENNGSETNGSLFAGVRLGEVDERPRRVNLSVGLSGKLKRDQARTETKVTGYMTTLYRDSTAQAKAEVKASATAAALLHQWTEPDERPNPPRMKAGLNAAAFDLAYAAEVRTEGVTHFCTLFTIDKRIDPVRSDCATDFQDFDAFEREVRREWQTWVHYGTAKVPSSLGEGMRYAVAEKQLENLLAQGRAYAKQNKFATAFMDKALKASAAPMLDGLRTLASLQRKAGREALASQTDRLFDDLIAQPALWEPTLLLIREKSKVQAERGIDFIAKYQNNLIAEAVRTVGQWPQYEPVLRTPKATWL